MSQSAFDEPPQPVLQVDGHPAGAVMHDILSDVPVDGARRVQPLLHPEEHLHRLEGLHILGEEVVGVELEAGEVAHAVKLELHDGVEVGVVAPADPLVGLVEVGRAQAVVGAAHGAVRELSKALDEASRDGVAIVGVVIKGVLTTDIGFNHVVLHKVVC